MTVENVELSADDWRRLEDEQRESQETALGFSNVTPIRPENTMSVEQPRKNGFQFVQAGKMEARPAAWLVKHCLEQDCLVQFFGDPESCKTFGAIDVGLSVATGADWNGHAVKRGSVFYIAGEGFRGLERRVKAWSIARRVSICDVPFFISRTAASLCDPESVMAVEEAIETLSAVHGTPSLIEIDTVARNFAPGDDNSTQDMAMFVQALDRLRYRWRCAVLVAHHSGHADKNRSRGSMVLKGALDWEYKFSRDEDGSVRMECIKAKDHEKPAPMQFRVCPVDLGILDEDGEPVTSAVLESIGWTAPAKASKAGHGKNQKAALGILRDMVDGLSLDSPLEAEVGIQVAAWRARCEAEAGIDRSRWREVHKGLSDARMIREEDGHVWLK